MKITEITESIAKVLPVGDYTVKFTAHLFEQMKKRKLTTRDLSTVLSKFDNIKDELDNLPVYDSCHVIDKTQQVSLGIRKTKENELVAVTIINTSTPYARGVDTFFYV